MLMKKTPDANGLSWGPMMVACQWNMSLLARREGRGGLGVSMGALHALHGQAACKGVCVRAKGSEPLTGACLSWGPLGSRVLCMRACMRDSHRRHSWTSRRNTMAYTHARGPCMHACMHACPRKTTSFQVPRRPVRVLPPRPPRPIHASLHACMHSGACPRLAAWPTLHAHTHIPHHHRAPHHHHHHTTRASGSRTQPSPRATSPLTLRWLARRSSWAGGHAARGGGGSGRG